MATTYSLPWTVYGNGYVATIAHTIPISLDPLTVYLRGSFGKDNVVARNIEISARLTTSPFVITIDGVPQTIPIGGYASLNIAEVSDRIVLSAGAAGDVITLNFYDRPRTEWR